MQVAGLPQESLQAHLHDALSSQVRLLQCGLDDPTPIHRLDFALKDFVALSSEGHDAAKVGNQVAKHEKRYTEKVAQNEDKRLPKSDRKRT